MIQWTTGDSDGGVGGLGGDPADVGLVSEDPDASYFLGISNTSEVVDIESTGNFEVSGLWVFRADQSFIIFPGTCCCYLACVAKNCSVVAVAVTFVFVVVVSVAVVVAMLLLLLPFAGNDNFTSVHLVSGVGSGDDGSASASGSGDLDLDLGKSHQCSPPTYYSHHCSIMINASNSAMRPVCQKSGHRLRV